MLLRWSLCDGGWEHIVTHVVRVGGTGHGAQSPVPGAGAEHGLTLTHGHPREAHLVQRSSLEVTTRTIVAHIQLRETSLWIIIEGVATTHHIGLSPHKLNTCLSVATFVMTSNLSIVTGVHSELERINVPCSPVVFVDLIKPPLHMSLKLWLVFVGWHSVVAPGGGHILTHGIPM